MTNVVLFDKEPDGVASVRFGNAQAAEACVRASTPLSHSNHDTGADCLAAYEWAVV